MNNIYLDRQYCADVKSSHNHIISVAGKHFTEAR